VVNLMDALRRSVGREGARRRRRPRPPRSRGVSCGQEGNADADPGRKPAKETAAKKPAAKPQRKTA
jgi:DNA end-binding protein Ku